MNMKIEAEEFGKYVRRYIQLYNEEYNKLTDAPPLGGGYPKMPISPYLKPQNLNCLILQDGVVIFDRSVEPEYDWYIAGGPAIKVDYEPSVTPQNILNLLKDSGLYGKPIGIYRVVSKTKLSDKVWKGKLETANSITHVKIAPEESIAINAYEIDLQEAVRRLTFGAFCSVLDIHLKSDKADFGEPHIIRNLGFFPADLNSRIFFNYLEIHPHVGKEAWDIRNIKLRVKSDVRRDLLLMLNENFKNNEGASLSFGEPNIQLERFNSVLIRISNAIREFQELLQLNSDSDEQVFHRFLENNAFLIDLYGNVESKPRLEYPENEKSPIGKSLLIPDFIVSYPDQSYKLIEIERPSKELATQVGHPRQDFNQAAFQIGEWKHYIKNHYSTIKTRYPGIVSKFKTSIIMSRSTQGRFEKQEHLRSYIEILRETTSVDEIITYDDLLEKTKVVYYKLLTLH